MKVGIVGTRRYDNFEDFEKIILNWEKENGEIIKIISGGAKGADTLAEKYAQKYEKEMEIFYPQWDLYGRSAGPKRNTLIVNNSDYLIAFPAEDSIGTYDSIRKADKKEIPVFIYNYSIKKMKVI